MTTTHTRAAGRTPSRTRHRSAVGLLLLAAGVGVLMAIITAAALYPADYRSSVNTVSDLAAMRPADVVRQASAAIFNVRMIAAGLAIAAAAGLLARAGARLSAVLPLAGLALGMAGIGVFPANTVLAVHQLVSLLAFLSGGLAGVLAVRLVARPLRPVLVVLGAVALAFLLGYELLGGLPVFQALGEGGVERWIVYPVALTLVVLGSALAGARPAPAPATGDDDRACGAQQIAPTDAVPVPVPPGSPAVAAEARVPSQGPPDGRRSLPVDPGHALRGPAPSIRC
jgi:hypothetical membrane protein